MENPLQATPVLQRIPLTLGKLPWYANLNTCMPTPIHDNIANYAMLDTIGTLTGMYTYDTGMGIRVYHNSGIETTGDGSSGR